ncbi:hypothetical protein N1851_019868 [Merluccius polli]|uniref:Uncharacterized protein n=1 Tax=Merluccius polli TaxID=89951 RepID=A0AA47ML83_MERPO|nr:hypothetical protein N1851_019868 [Merluccius polli]
MKRRKRRRERRQKRGCRSRVRARLSRQPHKPSLPSLFITNARSLPNKIEELELTISTQKNIQDCCVMVITETWLTPTIPAETIKLAGRIAHRADRTPDSTYRPRICTSGPTTKVLQVWPEGASEQLRDCFSDTDWTIFEEDNIDTYSASVLFYIKCCMENITTTKQIRVFPNNKPWMTRGVRLLLKTRNTAFQTGVQQYKAARANLKRGIKDAKAAYKQKIEDLFSSSDPRRAWQGIRHITRQNNTSSTISGSVLEAEQLNRFFARFEAEGMSTTSPAPDTNSQTLVLQPADVTRTLCRINTWKATGTDGVPGRVFRDCAAEKANPSQQHLRSFYRCSIESVLTYGILSWYGSSSAADRKTLQSTIKTAQNIINQQLPTMDTIFNSRCLQKTHNILKDPFHPANYLFELLPSGKRYRSIRSRTTRLINSFYPKAITILNSELKTNRPH